MIMEHTVAWTHTHSDSGTNPVQPDTDYPDAMLSPDPVKRQGEELAQYVIQELAYNLKVPRHQRTDILESLCSCVTEILTKHAILFNGMIHRVEVDEYIVFSSIANELFEANANNETGQLRITWGRVIALFAFAVRLAREYREDRERVSEIIRYLTTYLTNHVISFVKESGGWKSLVQQFPPPEPDSHQLKRAILWSGLCIGLAATMYVTSLLR